MPHGTAYTLEINPRIPSKLARLEDLVNNLWYSWDRPTRTLFSRLHPGLWATVGHNPKEFLKRIDEQKLLDAAEDPVFLATYNRVLSSYDTYHSDTTRRNGAEQLKSDDLVAYFCFEFGFHESFPIYSGGLGILAGDHCKAASDIALPFVGVGLLYRQGYFFQSIDSQGNQLATYTDSDFDDLPVIPVKRPDGSELHVQVELPHRTVEVKVWQSHCGHIQLYLLDTDLEINAKNDRDITHRLYGGDKAMRIEQELVLGWAGRGRCGHRPQAHGMAHQRGPCRIHDSERAGAGGPGLTLAAAIEAVAVSTVFTTHTAVPAGHDHFPDDMMTAYFEKLCRDLKLGRDEFISLGKVDSAPEFNMTALALRGSRFHNGVSNIHGGVSSRICRNLWPQIDPEENPMTFVTNGVHVPTFLSQEWAELFDRVLGNEWRNNLCDAEFWERIHKVPDHLFWSVRQSLKAQMLFLVRHRVGNQHFRNHGSEAHLDRMLRYTDPESPNVLTVGFARRFATYKRAALLFENLDWLKEIMADEKRPVLFLFAGKAHPADIPGQDLIRRVAEISRMPEFEGKLLLLEGYDLHMARRLVSGVDVWLNNPIYPLEASGTSGMKAGINGVINLSVLDGWWGEGYDGKNGWAIKPGPENMDPVRRNREESRTLYEILQDHVIPLYYERGTMGYSPGWVRMAKHSIASLMPRFNSTRMAGEYVTRFYAGEPAGRPIRRWRHATARTIAQWKTRVRQAWHGVTVRRLDSSVKRIHLGTRCTPNWR